MKISRHKGHALQVAFAFAPDGLTTFGVLANSLYMQRVDFLALTTRLHCLVVVADPLYLLFGLLLQIATMRAAVPASASK